MRDAWYHTSLICLNGHVLTDRIDDSPEKESPYCPRCSEPTISTCPNCSSPIRGYYEVAGISHIGRTITPAPNYCFQCGKAFTWTEKYLKVAKEMAAELEDLTEEEQELLQQSIDVLMTDSPEVQLAATRFNRMMKKVKQAGQPLRELMIELVAETTKRMLSP